MNRIKQILKALFVFVIPLSLVLNFLFLFINYNAIYYYKGVKYFTNYLYGFPIPDSGLFTDINSMVTSGNTTTHWTYYFLNKIIILTVCFLIYFFLFRKLHLVGKTKIFVLTLVTIIYLYFGWMTFIFTSMRITYDYGVWPEKTEIENIRWQAP